MSAYIEENPFSDKEVKITLNRDEEEVKVTVVPEESTIYSSGFYYNLGREKQSILGTIKYSAVELRYEINTVLKSLKMLITGQVSANEVSGPVGIVNVIGDTYSQTKSEGFMITLFTSLTRLMR